MRNAAPTAAVSPSPLIPLSVDLLFESSPDCAKVLDLDGKLQSMNQNGRCVMEIDDFNSVCGTAWPDLWPEDARPKLYEALEQARRGELGHFVASCPTAKGTPKWWDVRVTPIHDRDGLLQGFLSVSRDVTALQQLISERRRAEMFSDGQKRALEQAVAGAALDEVLDTLVSTAEAYVEGTMRASVLLLDRSGKYLRTGAAPSLPQAYNHAVDGMAIGPAAGSCGTAAYLKRPVFVQDIATDPLWDKYRELAEAYGLQSCWSHPILSSKGAVLGTFAFYYREQRNPTELEGQAMQVLVHTAALVLERHQEAQERSMAERALDDARMRLEATLAAGEVATWIYDIPSNQVTGDRNFREFFGIPAQQAAEDHDALCMRTIHPEDREGVHASVRRAIANREAFEAAYRLRAKDGSYRHVIARGKVQYGDDGAPLVLPGVLLDITTQKQAEEEIRSYAVQLAEINRRKTEFLATLAHELRNPLAPIRNGLELLRLAGGNTGTAERVHSMMSRQVNHMVHLIDDLLDIARIDSGKIDLRMERLDLKPIIASAIEASLPLIEAAHHELEVAVADEALLLDADATRLAQVLSNLLTNAAKYTPERGRIRLTACRDGSEVVLSVSDTGIGIPSQALGSIFEMFAQVKHGLGRTQGGLGIGLSLANRLLQMHGGSVTAASPGEGLGSTFTVRLPLVASQHVPDAPGPESREANAGQDGKSIRILVVDDNEDAAESMAALLRARHHLVNVANDGHHALQLIKDYEPHLVFLDIGMPVMDGYEVARRIRNMPDRGHVRLVALTGWGAEHDRASSKKAGFDYHLTKPASLETVEGLIADLPLERQSV
jgi:PAS domain S-box-containing protein